MIVYCCTDLMFASKIKAAADALGLSARPARDAVMLANRLNCVDDGKGHDPVTGVIIDLGLEAVAMQLLAQVKTHDPKLPVAAFGAHVLTEALQNARAAGADFVLTNGQMANNLEAILERLAAG